MNNNIFVELTNPQAKELKKIWKRSTNSSHSVWALALLLSNKKFTVQCIERRLQEKKQTIRSWYKRFKDEEMQMFTAEKSKGGRPPILSKKHLKLIRGCVDKNSKNKKKSIDCIQKRLKKLNIEVEDSTIVKYFKKYGIEIESGTYGMAQEQRDHWSSIREAKQTAYEIALAQSENVINIVKFLEKASLSIIKYADLPDELKGMFSKNEIDPNMNYVPFLLKNIIEFNNNTRTYLKENESKLLK